MNNTLNILDRFKDLVKNATLQYKHTYAHDLFGVIKKLTIITKGLSEMWEGLILSYLRFQDGKTHQMRLYINYNEK